MPERINECGRAGWPAPVSSNRVPHISPGNQIAAIPGNISDQNWFSAFGGPDQVIEDQMQAVFISLIFHRIIDCRILYLYYTRYST